MWIWLCGLQESFSGSDDDHETEYLKTKRNFFKNEMTLTTLQKTLHNRVINSGSLSCMIYAQPI
jgi:hypothetical protein